MKIINVLFEVVLLLGAYYAALPVKILLLIFAVYMAYLIITEQK